MAKKICLAAYTLRIRTRRSMEYLALGELPGGDDFYTVFNRFVAALREEPSHDGVDKRLISVKTSTAYGRRSRCQIETGEYGYESDLLDVAKRERTHRRKKGEAEMLPFYMLADIPVQGATGIVILQRLGVFGIRKTLVIALRKYLDEQGYDLCVEMNPLVSAEIARQYAEEGAVKGIRFISRKIPPDLSERLQFLDAKEVYGTMELVLKPPKGSRYSIRKPILAALLKKTKSVSDLIELPGDFRYDTVKIEVDRGGEKKVMDLADLQRVRSTLNITDEVRLGSDGHPLYESIDEVARTYLDEVTAMLGQAH